MNNTGQHIVSRLHWNTSFDDRGAAYHLQNDLSYWSRTKILSGMNTVFEELCTPSETWRIDLLELDLGTLYTEELESTLPQKISECLRHKLIDLLNENPGEVGQITIFPHEVAQAYLIETYLVSGYMPWNYSSTYGDLKQLFLLQLTENREEFRAMIRRIGKEEKVRKRLAWQLSDPLIKQLIQLLEPVHHEYIIDYAEDLTKTQVHTTLFKTNTAQFKKDVWLWVLNHLLIERGTLFNRLDFMKSSLRQMSKHYHIDYNELLEFLKSSLIVLEKKTIADNKLLGLLTILFEDESIKQVADEIFQEENDWDQAKTFFLEPETRKSEQGKSIFNELIENLYEKDSYKFRDLLSLLPKTTHFWSAAFNDMSAKNISNVFKELAPHGHSVVDQGIFWLQDSGFLREWNIEEEKVYEWSVSFLNNNRGKPFSLIQFFDYFLTQLAILSQEEHTQWTERLLVFLSEKEKDNFHIQIYENIFKHYRESLTHKSQIAIQDRVHVLLEHGLALSGSIRHHVKFQTWKSVLGRYIQVAPTPVLKAMIDYPHKKILREWIVYGLESYQIEQLLTSFNHPWVKFIQKLKQQLEQIFKNQLSDARTHLYIEGFMLEALLVFVERPKAQSSDLKNRIYSKLIAENWMQLPIEVHRRLAVVLLHGDEKQTNKFLDEKRKEIASNHQWIPSWDEITVSITKQEITPSEVAKMLMTLFRSKKVSFAVVLEENSHDIINYLVPKAFQLWGEFKKEYNSKRDMIKPFSLVELFWRCILDYEAHRGNPAKLRDLLTKAMTYVLSDVHSEKQKIDEHITIEKKHTSKHPLSKDTEGKRVEVLFDYVFAYKTFPLWVDSGPSDTLVASLKKDIMRHPLLFYRTLVTQNIKDLSGLDTIITMNTLIDAIMVAEPTKKELLVHSKQFYAALGHIRVKGIAATVLLEILFQKVIKAIQSGRWKLLSAKWLLNELVWELSSKRGIDSKITLEALQEVKNILPLPFQKELRLFSKQQGLKANEVKMEKKEISKPPKQTQIMSGVEVRNAGLVIISGYMATLFNRLGLIENGAFINADAQMNAVHYLQYVATGMSHTEEMHLPLTKVLVGLHPSEPVLGGIEIPESDKELIEGMILAMIQHWNSIGESSIQGFRGNWLVRDGMLTEMDDRWELTVEKRAYDILLNRSPFSFSITKHPWMEKPLHVKWEY